MVVAAGEARGDIGAALDRLADVLERNRAIASRSLNALIYPGERAGRGVPVARRSCLASSCRASRPCSTSFRHEPPLAMRAAAWRCPVCRAELRACRVLVADRRHSPRSSCCAGAMRVSAWRWTAGSWRCRGSARCIAKVESRTARLSARQPGRRRRRSAGAPLARGARDHEQRRDPRRARRGRTRHRARRRRYRLARRRPACCRDLALELVRVGEETGDLAPMLLKASDILRREIEAATQRDRSALVAPLSMVVLGLIIGAIAAGDLRHGDGGLRHCLVSEAASRSSS